MKRNNKKGFTIVELVIVIAVIAILAAVMIPTFGAIVEDANKSSAISAGRSIYTEVTAADLLDDGLYNASKTNANATYTCADNAITAFSYNHSNGYTATLEIATGKWTAAKTTP